MANQPVPFRYLDEYGRTQSVLTKLHAEALEGFYYTANNAQTALSGGAATGFVTTTPSIIIQNNNPAPVSPVPNGPSQLQSDMTAAGVNIYLDYIRLSAAAVGSAASGATFIAAALYIDNILRFSSGGTQLTPMNANFSSKSASNAQIYAGAPTALAQSAQRAVVGELIVRPCVSATVPDAVGDQFLFDFGSLEGGLAGNITVANPLMSSINLPPIVIPPQCSALLYLFYPGAVTPAASYLTEVGFWER